jgi:hypothetical protein
MFRFPDHWSSITCFWMNIVSKWLPTRSAAAFSEDRQSLITAMLRLYGPQYALAMVEIDGA